MLKLFIVPLLLLSVTVSAEGLYRSTDQSEAAEYIGTDAEGITVEFTLPALTAETEILGDFGSGTVMRIPGEGEGMPVGSPDLPVIRRMVLIPNTGDVSVEIVSVEFPRNAKPASGSTVKLGFTAFLHSRNIPQGAVDLHRTGSMRMSIQVPNSIQLSLLP